MTETELMPLGSREETWSGWMHEIEEQEDHLESWTTQEWDPLRLRKRSQLTPTDYAFHHELESTLFSQSAYWNQQPTILSLDKDKLLHRQSKAPMASNTASKKSLTHGIMQEAMDALNTSLHGKDTTSHHGNQQPT